LPPVVSYLATLGILGVAFLLLHGLILLLDLPDLAALLLFALPVSAYIAYCTQPSRAALLRFTLRIYVVFATTVLASAALVYYIG